MSATPPVGSARLLAGQQLTQGAEGLRDHQHRLGPLPQNSIGLLQALDRSGLHGRGGAAFPVARKWAAVIKQGGGDARVLVNGAEGEPLSAKDRTLMTVRPHLVLDGAQLAAQAVGAREIVLYVGEAHGDARRALERALVERGRTRINTRIVAAPDAFVAGEESAAVHYINDGDGQTRGTTLVTLQRDGRGVVSEIEFGTRVGEVVASQGAAPDSAQAVLLGGYHGTWLPREDAWALPLDPATLRAANVMMGTGVIGLLPHGACGVASAARITDYLAAQSAAQCGPCVFGLRSIADAMLRLSGGSGSTEDLARIQRWTALLTGRGGCRHPDGAAVMISSALVTFAEDFTTHARRRGCLAARSKAVAA